MFVYIGNFPLTNVLGFPGVNSDEIKALTAERFIIKMELKRNINLCEVIDFILDRYTYDLGLLLETAIRNMKYNDIAEVIVKRIEQLYKSQRYNLYVQLLLDASMKAIEYQNNDILEFILRRGKLNPGKGIDLSNYFHFMLKEAAFLHNKFALSTLVSLGADTKVYRSDGTHISKINLLHIACYGCGDYERFKETVKYLVQIGVEKNAPDNIGDTPLDRMAFSPSCLKIQSDGNSAVSFFVNMGFETLRNKKFIEEHIKRVRMDGLLKVE